MILASMVAKQLRIDVGTTESTGLYMNGSREIGCQMGYTGEYDVGVVGVDGFPFVGLAKKPFGG